MEILVSYAYLRKAKGMAEITEQVASIPGVTLLIDSGAYTAFEQGEPIDVHEYCRWCQANSGWTNGHWGIIALDVIQNAKGTADNLDVMVNQYGLQPIPVLTEDSLTTDVVALAAINPRICIAGGLRQPQGIFAQKVAGCYELLNGKCELHVLGYTPERARFGAIRTHAKTMDSSSLWSCAIFGKFECFNRVQGLYTQYCKRIATYKIQQVPRWLLSYFHNSGVRLADFGSTAFTRGSSFNWPQMATVDAWVRYQKLAREHGKLLFVVISTTMHYKQLTVCLRNRQPDGLDAAGVARDKVKFAAMKDRQEIIESFREAVALDTARSW